MNKPVGEFCWIITETLNIVDPNEFATQGCSTSLDVQPENPESLSTSPTEQAAPEAKSNSDSKSPVSALPMFDETVVPEVNISVSARSKRNYNNRKQLSDSEDEESSFKPEDSKILDKSDAPAHNTNVQISCDTDSDDSETKIGFGEGCAQDEFDTGDEMTSENVEYKEKAS